MKNVVSIILKQHFEKKKKDFSGLSTRWLAIKLSVSQVYVSQILSGKRALPTGLLDPLCDLLDIDQEKRELIASELLKSQGWNKIPAKATRDTDLKSTAHSLDWQNVRLHDLSKISQHGTLMVLEATRLEDYTGTVESLGAILDLPESSIQTSLNDLATCGLLTSDDKPVKSSDLLEIQSRFEKEEIRQIHKAALELASVTMDTKKTASDLEERLITTSLFTCSREHIPALRVKIAEFIKEVTAEAATQEPQELYQFGIVFFPVSKKDRKVQE